MAISLYDQALDLLHLHRLNPQRYPHLLGSTSVSDLSRYSLLFAFPQEVIKGKHLFNRLDEILSQTMKLASDKNQHLPFRGGWFVYLGYEMAGHIEKKLSLSSDCFNLPEGIAVRIPAAIIVDHVKQQSWVMTESDQYNDEFNIMKQDVDHAIDSIDKFNASSACFKSLQVDSLIEDEPNHFKQSVDKIAHYIEKGDVFQVNISRAWNACVDKSLTAIDLYEALALKNPAPFSALVNFSDFSIISSSPERLVRVNKGWVETRPIAGTRPRSNDLEKDLALMNELIRHPKEQAEHIMLLDLERNDLGRICVPGSVEVNELMVVESYQHVHHIVSNVRGKIRQSITPMQVIQAVFPGGTITGCPKVRCMEIIAELESVGRGVYTGSVGYINHNGEMDFNILIRTFVKQGNKINFRTGAGIVYDSKADNELEETRHKAKGLLNVFLNSDCIVR